jgi:hypothetical protein
VTKDRDELALKGVLGYTRLKGVTFWRITDLYRDIYYFGYVVRCPKQLASHVPLLLLLLLLLHLCAPVHPCVHGAARRCMTDS